MEVIEAMCEAGMLPADEVATGYLAQVYEGLAFCPDDATWVGAVFDGDELWLRKIGNGPGLLTLAEVRFNAPDGELSDLNSAAFVAVVGAWSK